MPHPLGSFVSLELLARLSELFPERCARPGMDLADIWMEAGEQRVIRKLRDAFEEANTTTLEPE